MVRLCGNTPSLCCGECVGRGGGGGAGGGEGAGPGAGRGNFHREREKEERIAVGAEVRAFCGAVVQPNWLGKEGDF